MSNPLAPALSEAAASEFDALSGADLIAVLAEYLTTRRPCPDATGAAGFRKIAAFVLKNLVLGA
jgi:hypothetical protein